MPTMRQFASSSGAKANRTHAAGAARKPKHKPNMRERERVGPSPTGSGSSAKRRPTHKPNMRERKRVGSSSSTGGGSWVKRRPTHMAASKTAASMSGRSPRRGHTDGHRFKGYGAPAATSSQSQHREENSASQRSSSDFRKHNQRSSKERRHSNRPEKDAAGDRNMAMDRQGNEPRRNKAHIAENLDILDASDVKEHFRAPKKKKKKKHNPEARVHSPSPRADRERDPLRWVSVTKPGERGRGTTSEFVLHHLPRRQRVPDARGDTDAPSAPSVSYQQRNASRAYKRPVSSSSRRTSDSPGAEHRGDSPDAEPRRDTPGAAAEHHGDTPRQRRAGLRRLAKLGRLRGALKQELESGNLRAPASSPSDMSGASQSPAQGQLSESPSRIDADVNSFETQTDGVPSDVESGRRERLQQDDAESEISRQFNKTAEFDRYDNEGENTSVKAARQRKKANSASGRGIDERAAEELAELQFELEFLKNIKPPPSKRAMRESIVSIASSDRSSTSARSHEDQPMLRDGADNASNVVSKYTKTKSAPKSRRKASERRDGSPSDDTQTKTALGRARNDVNASSCSIAASSGTHKDVMSLSYRLIRSNLGLSRRECDRLIWGGRVAVNGEVAQKSRARKARPKDDAIAEKESVFDVSSEAAEPSSLMRVSRDDVITVDGKEIPYVAPEAPRIWCYHKPKLELVAKPNKRERRRTVFDTIAEHAQDDSAGGATGKEEKPAAGVETSRLLSVGRLDFKSEGLLLFTNSGDMKRALESPKVGVSRKYRVAIHGRQVSPKLISALADGLNVHGFQYKNIKCEVISSTPSRMHSAPNDGELMSTVVDMTLSEGKNREIRKIFDHLGYTVESLVRVSYGPFDLWPLKQKEFVEFPVPAELLEIMEANES